MLCPVFVFVAQCRVKFLTNFHQPKMPMNCIIKKLQGVFCASEVGAKFKLQSQL